MPILKTSLNPSRARKVASIHTNEPTSVQITGNQTDQLGKILAIRDRARRTRERPHSIHRDQPRASSHINDSYCVISLQKGLLARSKTLVQEKTLNTVNFHVVTDVPSAPGHSQKRELSPGAADYQISEYHKLKYVKLASCVTQLSCVQPVNNVPNVVQNLPVGARLQNFWETWSKLGAGPKTVQILKEGYTLPFRTRPNLTRSPTVISCYANPHRNSYLLEALHQLTDKNAVELVRNQTSLGFFNRLFLVPKPNNKWRPILDLSKLNLFLKVEKFKMETPETIRTSLQQGEWVTSVDFKDAYFHIPIQEQSKKYLRFHIQGQTYQFKAIPFVHSPHGVHCNSQRGETDGRTPGYKDPPVPRRLVGESQIQTKLPPAYPDFSQNVPGPRLAGEFRKIRAGTQTSLRLCRLPIRPQIRPGPTDSGPVEKPSGQDTSIALTTDLSGPAIHVTNRTPNGHRKAGSPWSFAHETHTVASQKSLESTRVT